MVPSSTDTSSDCKHEEMIEDDGAERCVACGYERLTFCYDQEWRCFADTKGDPSRCHIANPAMRNEIVTIDNLLPNVNLSRAIRAKIYKKFTQIVGKDPARGKRRDSVAAACLMFVYMEDGIYKTSSEICKQTNIDQKDISYGLNKYLDVFPEDRTKMPGPRDLIREICVITKIPLDEHYDAIFNLADTFESIPGINEKNPKSISAACVYLYLCMHPELKTELNLTKKKFASKVKLSELTISSITKSMIEILKARDSDTDT